MSRLTIPEIIETLKVAKAEVEWNYPLDYAIAIDETVKILEKQIPKKVINIKYCHGIIKHKKGNCSVCAATANSSRNNYCRKCGQALDWS